MEIFNQLVIKVEELTGVDITKTNGCRDVKLVDIRSAINKILLDMFGVTTLVVADLIGYKDHTSCVYHRKEHMNRYRDRQYYQWLYNELSRFAIKAKTEDTSDIDDVLEMVRSMSV